MLPLVSNEAGDNLLISEGGSNSCTAVDGEDVIEEARGDEEDGPAALALPDNSHFSSTVSPTK